MRCGKLGGKSISTQANFGLRNTFHRRNPYVSQTLHCDLTQATPAPHIGKSRVLLQARATLLTNGDISQLGASSGGGGDACTAKNTNIMKSYYLVCSLHNYWFSFGRWIRSQKITKTCQIHPVTVNFFSHGKINHRIFLKKGRNESVINTELTFLLQPPTST